MNKKGQKDKQIVTISESEGTKFIEIKATDNGDKGLRGISPFSIYKAITNACQGSPASMKSIARGTMLMVECCSREMAMKLCGLTFIQTPEKSIKLSMRENFGISLKSGAIYMPEIADCPEEENNLILKALKEQNPAANVENFRRLKRKVNENLVNTGTLIINFRSETLPTELNCLYFNAPVREFYPDPLRCFRCLSFGHTAKFCKKKENDGLCVNCGQKSHVNKNEKCSRPSKCAHCHSVTHHSASRQCPVFKVEKAIVECKYKKNLSWRTARTQVLENWPTRISSITNNETSTDAPELLLQSITRINEVEQTRSDQVETPSNPTIFKKIDQFLSNNQLLELDSNIQKPGKMKEKKKKK